MEVLLTLDGTLSLSLSLQASRAVDVVLTYQDMKRCYAIYRAFLREDDRAGFSKSKVSPPLPPPFHHRLPSRHRSPAPTARSTA